MAIHIGNNNTIKNSLIADKSQINQEKKNWAQRHPIISGVLISVIAGVILLCLGKTYSDDLIKKYKTTIQKMKMTFK